MKKLLLSAIMALSFSSVFAQVGINTETPHSSAVLDVVAKDGNKGLLIPRLTSTAIQTLSATAAEGLLVYDTTNHRFMGWNGSSWVSFGNTAPYATNVDFTGSLTINSTLQGSYTYNDDENNTEAAPVFSWKRANDAAGSGEAVISGATSSNYSLASADVGKYISFCVQPIATAGATHGAVACSAFKGAVASVQTGVIALENFDSGNYTSVANGGFGFSETGNGFSIATGGSGTSIHPNSANMYTSASGALRKAGNGSSSTYIQSAALSLGSYTNNITFSLRLASFSGSSNNGADDGDFVRISFILADGTTVSDQLQLNGGTVNDSQNKWTFAGTGSATRAFSTSAATTTVTPTGSGTLTGSSAYTTLSVTGIPNTITGVRITLVNGGSNNEIWVIDDVKLEAL